MTLNPQLSSTQWEVAPEKGEEPELSAESPCDLREPEPSPFSSKRTMYETEEVRPLGVGGGRVRYGPGLALLREAAETLAVRRVDSPGPRPSVTQDGAAVCSVQSRAVLEHQPCVSERPGPGPSTSLLTGSCSRVISRKKLVFGFVLMREPVR